MSTSELAVSYAALILADEDIDVTVSCTQLLFLRAATQVQELDDSSIDIDIAY